MSELTELDLLRQRALKDIGEAGSVQELESLDIHYLGRKGEVTQLLRMIGSLPPERRREFGQLVNELKSELLAAIDKRRSEIAAVETATKLQQEVVDITLPGRFFQVGGSHVLVETLERIKEIFIGLGYEVVESPEVESYKYNFAALNYPDEHPALDEQMSFYITDERLLRTQTTAFQLRVMEARKPPLRVCTMGKCYRVDAVDATHSHTFHQVDCFTVDRGVTMADLKGTLHQFAVEMFGKNVQLRFRPDFFPFVEPGAEVAVTCTICDGQGCAVCKGTGWMELAGAGMIHPRVLETAGINSEEYTGFAFGFGVDRIPMVRYGIDDLRLFLENDLRFLRQLQL
ncbi:MAG: phenylalanine--tRNA ligase subunit alpha [Armatimonadota bacterium]